MQPVLVLFGLLGSVQWSPVCGTEHIVGGIDTVRGDFPWQCAVYKDDEWVCGGSMITTNWILTAAHCIDGDYTSFKMVMGAYNLDAAEGFFRQSRRTRDRRIHPLYDSNSFNNDIGVLHAITAFVQTTFVKTIRVPCCPVETDGKAMLFSGWGARRDGDTSSPGILQTWEFLGITRIVCIYLFGGPPANVRETQFCIYQRTDHATCLGDSGGALTLVEDDGIRTQVGIDSVGGVSCESGLPEVFTKVERFVSWLEFQTGPLRPV